MLNIIPTPNRLEKKDGEFSLNGCTVYTEDSADARVKRAATVLCREIGEKIGETVPLTCAAAEIPSIVLEQGDGNGEGYEITVSQSFVRVRGDGAAGTFYAIQTLRQLVKENDGCIPCCVIEDSPRFSVRGFYHDITRGRVNTPKKLREIVRMLSYYKINSLQLYIEDAFLFREFDGIITAEEALTPEEITELDSFCYEHFIELVPSLSTFGHLFTLLQSEKFNRICELPNHKMTTNYWMEKQWHHTVDVYNPDSVKVIGSMIEQYIPLFRSDKFNICCDETMDLCNGKNKGKDKGEAYFFFLNKLIETVKRHGKTVMMWGDECMAHPEEFKKRVPSDTVILNWCYNKEVPRWIPEFFSKQGFSQIVCPGCASWSRFIENIDASVGNITSFANLADEYNAMGILNTNWGDFGHICAFNCNLYGLLFGAQKSWNPKAQTGKDFEAAASLLLYDITEFNAIETIYNLGRAQLSADWFRFVMWHSANCLEGKTTCLDYSEDGSLTAEDAVMATELCKREIARLEGTGRTKDARIADLILAAEGIALMNREYLYVNGEKGFEDGDGLQEDFDLWLEKYSAAWLRDDKPSQLWRLCDFIHRITNVPVKK